MVIPIPFPFSLPIRRGTRPRAPVAVLILSLVAAIAACRKPAANSPPALPAPAPGESASKDAVGSSDVTAIPAEQLDRIVTPFNRGVGLMEQFRPSDAVKAFEEVVQLAPNWTTGRLNLGIALLNAQSDQSYARAEQELNRVISAENDNCYAHYALGMLFSYQSRFDEARLHFERVVALDPDDGDAHYQLGVLLAKKNPEAARRHLEETLQRIPHHQSACYHLQSLLRRAGEVERSQEMLARFQALKNSGVGVTLGLKYGEMGRYASVIRTMGGKLGKGEPRGLPVFRDDAERAGLVHVSAGVAGWPGESSQGVAHFGPGIAAADVDGDEDLDLFLPGVGATGQSVLYLSQGATFALAANTGIERHHAIGAYFGDYDGDGDADLFLTCSGPNALYRNDGGGAFTDVTETSGTAGGPYISVGASWADADHDGDLDLYVANFAPVVDPPPMGGVPNALWRNNGNGTFTDVAVDAGVDEDNVSSVGVTFFDADDDHDLDLYVINDRAPSRLFLNQRIGQYREATAECALPADPSRNLGGVLGDVDLNGREDLLLIRGRDPPRLFLQLDRGRFTEDHAFAAAVQELPGASGGLLGDLDLDGDQDLVLLAAGREQETGHRIMLNRGDGQFDPPIELGPQGRAPDVQGSLAVDLDGDGGLELIVARAGARPELWHSPAAAGGHWLEIVPSSKGKGSSRQTDSAAVGLQLEVKTGLRLQVASIHSSSGYLGSTPARAHFGLGGHSKVDYVRFSWPDAVLQSELEVAANQRWQVSKVARKPSSCPILFSWDGERFAFVTDFLGVGGVGFFSSPGVYAPPDPTEHVRIPPSAIQPRDGRYLLRVAEPLEEVSYIDQLHLLVYDHPADWEVHPDERFLFTIPPPQSPPRAATPFAVAQKIFPKSAKNARGADVLERVLRIDRAYAEPPVDPRFIGYAEDHWIELDFADQLKNIGRDARVVLYLYGWVEYTYSHVNYAAYQAGIEMRSPCIEVPDGNGGWRVALAEAGFPAGLPRMMTVDISSLPVRDDGRLRIRSNMEVFWDQIFIGEDVAGPRMQVRRLAPIAAQLQMLGYPREYSPDGAEPSIYDYQRRDPGAAFKNMTGDFTRLGDVRTLLDRVDDQFVIMGRGEEIALEFDAASLPELPEGYSRTCVLDSDGYCKDMDLYTAFPDSVEPLPFHAMENYPPTKIGLDSEEAIQYQRRWNTRRITGQ